MSQPYNNYYNTMIARQIILDTETTGINQIGAHYEGHKIIEIGAVEIINRRLTGNNLHIYLKPDRLIDPEAFNIHGITNEFLLDKPIFADIAEKFIEYIYGAELVIHNAPFDIGFIDYELSKLNCGIPKIETICKITDSLAIAKKMFPGKRNNLDALCLRYEINNTKRTLHSALLDAQILADIYLTMTGGQTSIAFNMKNDAQQTQGDSPSYAMKKNNRLKVISASNEEIINHKLHLDLIQKKSGNCIWLT